MHIFWCSACTFQFATLFSFLWINTFAFNWMFCTSNWAVADHYSNSSLIAFEVCRHSGCILPLWIRKRKKRRNWSECQFTKSNYLRVRIILIIFVFYFQLFLDILGQSSRPSRMSAKSKSRACPKQRKVCRNWNKIKFCEQLKSILVKVIRS